MNDFFIDVFPPLLIIKLKQKKDIEICNNCKKSNPKDKDMKVVLAIAMFLLIVGRYP